ncbi:MAG: radical SAM protein [bacterium]
MKVLLINPPSRRPIRSILPPEIEKERGLFPPLGILYLAGFVRDLPGVEVSVIDAQAEELSPDNIALRVREGAFDLVGITVMTFSLLDAMDTAMAIKAARPESVVVAGGPHPHLFPEETLKLGPFDAAFRGEGEHGFRKLLEDWPESRHHPPAGLWWKNGSKGHPDIAPFIDSLDSLAMPARDLSRLSAYHSVLSGKRPITTMMSSRGCPYKCVFCDRPHLGKRFRSKSAESVADEMEACAEAGIREIVFYDDTFTTDAERVRAIADAILSRGIKIDWDIRARVSDLSEEDYALCRRAGLARVHFGVESGDPDILRSLRKGITADQARQAFKWAHEVGLETLAYFMVGLPGETRESMQKTLELAKELDPDYVHFSALIPFPGTPVYKTGLEKGIIKRDVWQKFAESPSPDFTPPVWEENLSSDEILEELARMYRSFYRQPRVVLRRLRRVRSLPGLVQGAKMGSRILFLRGNK